MKQGYNNPLAVSLPYQFSSPDEYPTEVLANRFQAWRYIIKDLISYLREYASVQEEIVRQQIRLQQAVGISAKSIAVNHQSASNSHSHHHHGGASSNSANKEVDLSEINKFFLPLGNGSIQDLPTILTKYHQQNVNNTSKTLKELNSVIIPKLEELRKDLLIKIKEIKNLQNDFKNNLSRELQETKNCLSAYYQSIEISNKLEHGKTIHNVAGDSNSGSNSTTSPVNSSNSTEPYKFDPYLAKIKLDRQLKKQLQEETYLYQAYQNLQDSGGKLESIIFMELQNYISNFLNLITEEHSTIPNFLLPNLSEGFLAKEPTFEWDSFIAKNIPSPSIAMSAVSNSNSSIKNGTFIDLNFASRKFSDLTINNYNSALNLSVREGYLERRSKFLKNYSRGWYVLTCNFIHEFKTSDRKKDQIPILSILLDSCQVSDHSKNDGKLGGTYKFILTSKLSNGLMHRNQNWVFRTDTYQKMIDWYNDIKTLTSLPTPAARARHLNKKLKLDTHLNPNLVQPKISRASSILSNGTNNINARSLRTVETNQSKLTNRSNININEPGQSQSDLQSHNQYRLSSTFSNSNQKTQSPKLNQLINSDGTIITPVETNEKPQMHSPPAGRASTQPPPEVNQTHNQYQNQPYQPQYQPQLYPQTSQPQYHQVPITNIQQSTPQQPQPQSQSQPQPQQPQPQHPQSQGLDQSTMVLSPSFMPNFQQGYFITNSNGQQVQQFYDPIQQQYYSVTQQPAPQGPQPQYFPTSPQPQPQFHTSSPQPNNNPGYFFVPQGQQPTPAQGVPQQGQSQFGGNLPYPTDEDNQTEVSNVKAEPQESSVSTKEPENKENYANGEVNDTEDTLKNGSEDNTTTHEDKKPEDASMNGESEVSKTVSKLSI